MFSWNPCENQVSNYMLLGAFVCFLFSNLNSLNNEPLYLISVGSLYRYICLDSCDLVLSNLFERTKKDTIAEWSVNQ